MVGRTGVVKTSSHAQSTQNSEEEGPVLFGRTIQTMLDYCRETPGRRYTSLYRTIWILSQTAMRGGELLNLKWSEVQQKKIRIISTDDWEVKNRKDA